MAGYCKLITWFGSPAAVACDGQCLKAWGISQRPKRMLSDDEDDFEWLADDELPLAPQDPGTYEGECAKPLPHEPKLNKWCVRECERSVLYGRLEAGQPAHEMRDFTQRIKNKQ